MWQRLRSGITPRLYALIGTTVACALGLEAFCDSVKGPLDDDTFMQVREDWRKAPLSDAERAVLSYAEKGTLNESSVRKKDVEALRDAGLSDTEILTIATTIAYHNYACRVAAALGVVPRG